MSLTDDAWRSALHTAYNIFAPLLKQDITLNLPYGILSGAILWSVRDAEDNPMQRARLQTACSSEQLALLLKALRGWNIFDPLRAARAINKRATDNMALRDALDTVLAYCREDMLHYSMIKQITDSVSLISVGGDVRGGNVVIGGYQYVAGDLFVTTIQEIVKSCPTAPSPPKHFTGRAAELITLQNELTKTDAVAITAVRSMGGMGKTSLVQAFCHLPSMPFGAVLWAELTQSPQLNAILLTWGRYAKDSFTLPPETPVEQIADLVRAMLTELITNQCGGKTLVVFDDVWDNEACYSAVSLLRRAMPTGAQVLLTTRQEQVANDPRLKAHALSLNELLDSDAKLLLQRLIENKYVSKVHIDRAVELLKGHPLALELAAASLNMADDANHVPTILDDYERGIQEGRPFDGMPMDERPISLDVVFGRSYNVLFDNLKGCFRALGVLAADAAWDRGLGGIIWQIENEAEIRNVHQALRTRALLGRDEKGDETYGGVWYRQHPLLRSYALALLKQADELENTFARYADQVILIAEKFNELQLEQWGELTPYLPHIHTIGNGLVTRTSNVAAVSEIALKRAQLFALNTSRYLANRREVHHIDWTEMGLAVSRHFEDEPHKMWFLNELGAVYAALGDNAQAFSYFKRALSLQRTVGDRSGEAMTINNIGGVYSALGDNARAFSYFKRALSLQRAAGDRSGEAGILTNIGGVYFALGDNARALRYFKRALSLRRAVGDRRGEATVLNNIGRVYSALRENARALGYFEQALLLQRDVGHRRGEATILNNIGLVYDALGDKTQARDYYEQGLTLFRAVGDRSGEAMTLSNIGVACSALGNSAQVLDYYEQALLLIRAVGDRSGEATTLSNIGAVYADLGDKARALGYYEQALPLRRDVGDRSGEAATLSNIGAVYDDLGDKARALGYYEEALPLQRAVDDYSGAANTCFNIGMTYQSLGDLDKAIEFVGHCVELEKQVQHPNLEKDQHVLEQLERQRDGAKPPPQTLSKEIIQALAGNTVAVKTSVPDRLDEWHAQVQAFHDDVATKGTTWELELAFADALLAVLDNQPALLPGNNPYQPYLKQVLSAINSR